MEDIEMILDLTVYDGKVEKSIGADLTKRYRAVEPLLPAPGIVRTPCGVCPVSKFLIYVCPRFGQELIFFFLQRSLSFAAK